MKKVIYLAIILSWSCQNSSKDLIKDSNEMELEFVHLIDTFKNKLVLESASSITNANFHPMLISSCKLFKGNYLTKMRLVFALNRKIKSNEFEGKIDYRQFDKPIERR